MGKTARGLIALALLWGLPGPAAAGDDVRWSIDMRRIPWGDSVRCEATNGEVFIELYATRGEGGIYTDTIISVPVDLATVFDLSQPTPADNPEVANIRDTRVARGFGLDLTRHVPSALLFEDGYDRIDWFASEPDAPRPARIGDSVTLSTKINAAYVEELARAGTLRAVFLTGEAAAGPAFSYDLRGLAIGYNGVLQCAGVATGPVDEDQ